MSKDLNKLMGEYKDLEREQYVTQEPMSLEQVDELPELGAVAMNQEMEELPANPNLGEAKRLEDMMADLEGQGMEPEYMRELSVERDAMQAQQYAEDDQKVIDGMSFKDAFNQHYEQHKDTPIEERPYLKWKERDYLPYKADEKNRKPAAKKEVKSFFIPQTKSVNLDVDKDLLSKIEKAAKDIGEDSLVLSSGRRGEDQTRDILKSRKKKYNLEGFGDKQSLIDTMIMQGSSPSDLTYADRSVVNAKIRKEFPDRSDELIKTFKDLRSNFAGYKSPHLSGKKVDVPYSHFIKKYGKVEGSKKVEEFKRALKKNGIHITDEPNTGVHGVLDLKVKK